MPSEESSPKPPSTFTGAFGGVWQPPPPEALKDYFPQYEIVALLGRGGMGAVYKGWQRSLDRFVAIKILPPDMDDADGNFTERFKQEAKSMAKLMHPGIVAVFDAGETPTGLLYFVMEFVEGTDVAHMVQSQGKLPPEHALAITAHVCDALQYAHTHGIVHRDIKPANIMVNTEGAVKVADFGLAKHSDPAMGGLTKTNMAMGTPDYVAPEALITGMTVDGRADLYAVGVMLYQMLTGEIPRGMFMMPSIRTKGATDRRFDLIIAKAMQTDREMRYDSAAALRRDLDVILTVPLVKDAHSSAAIPKQSLPPKPQARQPQKPQGQPPAPGGSQRRDPKDAPAPAPNHESQIVNHKSKAGLYLGIAAAVAVLVALAFLFSGKKPAAETDATAAAETSAKPAQPIKVAETTKPPVIKTPKPKPAASITTASVPAASGEQWIDGLAEWWTKHGKEKLAADYFTRETGGSRVGKIASVRAWEMRGGDIADGVLRATVSGAATLSLALRTNPDKGRYRGGFGPGTGAIYFDTGDAQSETLKRYSMPPGFVATDRHAVEFRAQGDTFTFLLDGQELASVKDTRRTTGSGYLIAAPGTLIEKLEYRDLGGSAAHSASAKPAETAPAAGSGEQWVDGLAEWWATSLDVSKGLLAKEVGGSRLVDSSHSILFGKGRDVAVRATVQGVKGSSWHLGLRGNQGLSCRATLTALDRSSRLYAGAIGEMKILQDLTPPPDFSITDRHTLEFRAQGDLLTVVLDGKQLAQVQDSSVTKSGQVYFAGTPGTLVEKLEYRELAAPAPVASSGEPWVDVLARMWEKLGDKPSSRVTREAGGARVFNSSQGVPCGTFRDGIIRATVRGGKDAIQKIYLRHETLPGGEQTMYYLMLSRKDGGRITAQPGGGSTNIASFDLPTGFSLADRHVIEFGAQDDVFFAAIDGKEVARVRDGTLTKSGEAHFVGSIGTLIEKLEYRELPASAPAAAPKTITKDSAVAPMPQSGEKSVAAPAALIDPVSARLAEIEKQFLAAYAQQVTPSHTSAVADLNTKYIARLDRDIATASKASQLEDALALRNEKQQVETQSTISAEDAADMREVLKPLRKTYRDTMTTLIANRDKLVAPLHAAYDKTLAAYQDELTKSQKLDEAARVKAVREKLSSGSRQTSDGQGKASTTTQPATTTVIAASTNTPLLAATKDKPFTNSLGMKFVPVKGTDVLFCIHETRYKDYAAHAAEAQGVDGMWKNQGMDGFTPTENKEDHPVWNVSWEQAQAFCAWLSKKEGKLYRLPTDEEWSTAVGLGHQEKRPKGTTPGMLNGKEMTEFPWGGDFPPRTKDQAGNYSDENRKARAPRTGLKYLDGYDDGFPTTAPVMRFKPNKFGLYDMGGNVLEWCEDWFDNAQKDRVMRGGCWADNAATRLRSSARIPSPPGFRSYGNASGFRCVLVPSGPAPP